MSENAYVEFLKDVIRDEFNQEHSKETPIFAKNQIRAREINILGNLIRKLLSFQKNNYYTDARKIWKII